MSYAATEHASRKEPLHEDEKEHDGAHDPGAREQRRFEPLIARDVVVEALHPDWIERSDAGVYVGGTAPSITRPVFTVFSQIALTLNSSLT